MQAWIWLTSTLTPVKAPRRIDCLVIGPNQEGYSERCVVVGRGGSTAAWGVWERFPLV